MEEKNKEKIKEITKKILLILGMVGFIFILAAFPGLGYLFKGNLRKKRFNKEALAQALRKLKKEGLVLTKKEEGKTTFRLSKKGKKKFLNYKLEDLKINKPERWDGFWRIVAFDIPEEKKTARNALRRKLKELDFFKLQKSIFVYPYDCESEINLIREVFEIRPFVNLIIAKSIENEEKIKNYFQIND